jgi:hypothetical protein
MRKIPNLSLVGCVVLMATGCATAPEESASAEQIGTNSARVQNVGPSKQAVAPTEVPVLDAAVLAVSHKSNAYAELGDSELASRLGIKVLPKAEIMGGSVQTAASAAPARRLAAETGRSSIQAGFAATAEKRLYRSDIWSLMTRDVDAYTYYTRKDLAPIPSPDGVAPAIPDQERTLALANEWFGKLGLPGDEAVLLGARGLAAAGASPLGASAPTVVGRVVEYARKVGGLRVVDSRARFEFATNGELRSAMVYWPAFNLRPGLTAVLTNAEVSANVDAWVAGRKLYSRELVYRQAEDGYMVPAVMAIVRPSDRKFFEVAK